MPPTNGSQAKVLPILRANVAKVLTVEEIAELAGIEHDAAQRAMARIVNRRLWPLRVLAQGKVWAVQPYVEETPVSSAPVSPAPVSPAGHSIAERMAETAGQAVTALRALEPRAVVAASPRPERPDRQPRRPGVIPKNQRYTCVEDVGDVRILRDVDGYLWSARRIGLSE